MVTKVKTGIVFEGGAFRTIFSCGVMDALVENDIMPDYMIGVSAGAFITHLLGRWGDSGNLGAGFAMLAIVVAIALGVQLYFLRPKTDNME